MRIVILLTSLFLAYSQASASFSVLLDDGKDLSKSILAIGNGKNYEKISLENALSNPNLQDHAVSGFVNLLERFRSDSKIESVDALGAITRSTPNSAIKLNISISGGDSVAIFVIVDDPEGEIATFTPMKYENGKWSIGGDIVMNSKAMAVATIYLNFGRQISTDDAKKFIGDLESSKSEQSALAIPIIASKNINSFLMLRYETEGKFVGEFSRAFEDMLNAFKRKDASFYEMWAPDEAKNLRLFLEKKGYVPESSDIVSLDACSDGYIVLGASEFRNFCALYILDGKGEFKVLFAKRFHEGLKFTRSSTLGSCSTYIASLLNSEEFKVAFFASNAVSSVKDNLKAALSLLMQ